MLGVGSQCEMQDPVRLFLCGDVMLGRGIDQVLQHPCDPTLHEDYVDSALDYVTLAERAHGSIPRRAPPSYIWGAALEELAKARVDLRIVNLETSITRSDVYEHKGINYRVSPENAQALSAAHIDCCTLANNHVLDWGKPGLGETLSTLQALAIKSAGAGRSGAEAAAPAVLPLSGGCRLLVYAFASTTSGTPRGWAATAERPGVNLLSDLSRASADRIADRINRDRAPGDIAVVSVHWGGNWGYAIDDEQRDFAHALIDDAHVSVVHGHSSHHAKAIETYGKGLILYGCGDFINDYEGIAGYEHYRGDLSLMYLASINRHTGAFAFLDLVPLQVRQFRLVRANEADIDWLQRTLDRESRPFGTHVVKSGRGRLSLRMEHRGEA
jgi:poly-gamma-glutamate synthesis protein (capsule biosynthesis protein)